MYIFKVSSCVGYFLLREGMTRRECDLFFNGLTVNRFILDTDQPGHGRNGVYNSFDNSIHGRLNLLSLLYQKVTCQIPLFLSMELRGGVYCGTIRLCPRLEYPPCPPSGIC